MIEKFDSDSLSGKTILDPTSGSGNLLVACLIAGADPDKIFGNEYDEDMVILCRNRIKNVCKKLGKSGFKDYQVHVGNSFQKLCLTDFSENYEKLYRKDKIDDLNYAQTSLSVTEKESLW